jgi:hypothetical protein
MMSRDGDKYEFVETLRRRLYLNDVKVVRVLDLAGMEVSSRRQGRILPG